MKLRKGIAARSLNNAFIGALAARLGTPSIDEGCYASKVMDHVRFGAAKRTLGLSSERRGFIRLVYVLARAGPTQRGCSDSSYQECD